LSSVFRLGKIYTFSRQVLPNWNQHSNTHTYNYIFSAELFHELSKALEVLTDPKAKAAYDAVLKAKERARLRTQALDAKRKKFKQGKLLQTIAKQ